MRSKTVQHLRKNREFQLCNRKNHTWYAHKEIYNSCNPNPIRDLLFIDDHVNGYLALVESEIVPRAVNFCTGIGTSIKDLAELIKELLEWKGEIIWGRTMKRPTEIDVLIGYNALAKDALNWSPKVDLRTGLCLTIGKINTKLGRGYHDVDKFYGSG
jgi:nucleoside-diphosphate-sugar epimerase